MKNTSSSQRILPRNVSRNYRELYATYRPQLTEAAAKHGLSVSEILTRLRARRVIEGFLVESHIPLTFTWDEAVAFLGLTDTRWQAVLKRASIPVHRGRSGGVPWANVRPWTIAKGDADGRLARASDRTALYWGPDILVVADFMDEHGLTRKTPECARLESAFRRRIGWFLSTLKVKPSEKKARTVKPERTIEEVVSKPPVVLPEWPKDLPHDQEEMLRMYGPYVFDQVRRISTIKTEQELEEVTQEMWKSLVQSDVLGKFMEAARTKLPRTLTLAETLSYLGVSHKQWVNAVAYHQRTKSWMPTPVKGTPFGKDALYLTSDIQTLDASGFLKGRRNAERANPGVTGRGFKSYLAQAVKNHFKNLLRTRFRRHKERPLDPKVALASDGSGLCHKAAVIEDSNSWEEHLTDAGSEPDMESLIDFTRQLRRYGVDPNTEIGFTILDNMSRGVTLHQAMRQAGQQVMVVNA
jgi:hypothetical protein